MALIKGIKLSEAVASELHKTVAELPATAFVQLAELDKTFAHGFRPVPANAEKFRGRMLALVDRPEAIPPSAIEAIRLNSFQQSFTCVLSTRALVDGYRSLAAFVGEPRLLLSMLLDPRGTVVNKAADIMKSGIPISPQPLGAVEARAAMAITFGPFMEELSSILFPPPPASADAENPTTDLTTRKIRIKKLEDECRGAARKIVSLESKIEKLQLRTATLQAELSAAQTSLEAKDKELASSGKVVAALRKDVERHEKRINQLDAAFIHEKADKSSALESLNTLRAKFNALSEACAAQKRQNAVQEKMQADRSASEAAAKRAEFTQTLDKTVPIKAPRRTPRQTLAELTRCKIRENEKLLFLIDGHNVLNTLQKYAGAREGGAAHEELRNMLLRDIAQIQTKLGHCEIRLHFDGPTAGEGTAFGNPNLKVVFSGGNGDHRADRRIIDYITFYVTQADSDRFITVTEDQALRTEAAANGSLLLYPREFMALS